LKVISASAIVKMRCGDNGDGGFPTVPDGRMNAEPIPN